jgi:NAD(P)-dependent dehydrogenase (short-subunit alcohol dehydrogenase family)
MNLQLDGKTAFVSGSAAGIGLAIASTLAREGR